MGPYAKLKIVLRCRRELRFHCFEGSQNSLFLVSFLDPSQDMCFFHAWPPRGVTLGSQRTFRLRIGVKMVTLFEGILPSGRSGVHSCWFELDFHGLASQKESQMYPLDYF